MSMDTPFYDSKGNPCKECQDRHVGCHSGCEKHKEWKDRLEEKKQKYRTNKDEKILIDNYVVTAVVTTKKKSNRRK